MKKQKQLVIEFMSTGEPKSIAEVSEGTGILRPNVRRILGQGALSGDFKRVEAGVYVLTTADGKSVAYIQAGDAQEILPRLAAAGYKFDMVFLDPAYYSRALIGGNRGIKDYQFIMPAQFAALMQSVASVMRSPDSHVYVMLSGAATAQKDMERYVQGVELAGFKLVQEGAYQKTFKDGSPVTNVRGEVARPERLFLFTLSGQCAAGEVPVQMNYSFVRPKGYETEKAPGLLAALIKQSTRVGDAVLDLFGGSGVAAEQSILLQRSVVIVEKIVSVVQDYILPRVQGAIAKYNLSLQE